MLNMINSDNEMVDEIVDSCPNMSIKNEPEDFITSFNNNSNIIEESPNGSSTNVSDISSLNALSDLDGSGLNTSSSEGSGLDSSDYEHQIDSTQFDPITKENIKSSSSSIIFPLETIQIVSEQTEINLNLTEDAAYLIGEDISYRIRQLVHCAAQFMRHSFRTKLSTKDIFRAMQELDCDVILGHNNASDSEANRVENYYLEVPSAYVFVENDFVVDLKQNVQSFLKNESKHSDQCRTDLKQKLHTFDIEWFSLTNPICDNIYYISENLTLIDKYFKKLTEILLASRSSKMTCSEQERCLKIFYNDLSRNHSIKPLLCPLFYFIRNTLLAWNKLEPSPEIDLIAFSQVRIRSTLVFLNVLRSIIRNDGFIDLTMDSKVLQDFADTILMLCFDSNSFLSVYTYTKLYHQILEVRSSAAYLFTQIMYKFSVPFTDIQHRLIKMLYFRIKNRLKENVNGNLLNISSIDFSILNLHRFLGFDMCLRYLLPLLTDETSFFHRYFWSKENNFKDFLITKEINNLIKSEINLVAKLILKGFGLLLTQKSDDFITIDQSDSIYIYFYDHFGDSLCCSLCPVIEMPSFHQNKTVWLDNWQTLIPKRRKKSTNIIDQTIQLTSVENLEKSSNKAYKKKGLLESMLSTDTTKMAKNESLSMFTDSLLDSSHKQYEKIFLYQQDFDESSSAQSGTSSSLKYLVVFDGQRLPPKTVEDDEEAAPKKIRVHNASIPYKNSIWYNLTVNYRSTTPVRLPCFRNKFDYHHTNLDNHKRINKKKSFNLQRHQTFHYHRTRQHIRTNCSLYTQL